MSTTFSAAYDTTRFTHYQIECMDEKFRDDRTWLFGKDGYAEANIVLPVHNFTCPEEDCRMYGGTIYIAVTPGTEWMDGFNMNSANAQALLDLLGLGTPNSDGEHRVGSLPALDMIAAIAVVRSRNLPDLGAPGVDETFMVEVDMADGSTRTERAGSRWINFGRAPGYLDYRLDMLDDLAGRCLNAGVDVCWA